ncbi:MAG TPA: twin-arginine translocase TatA/TatE family subunit [Acidobacteriaceae bacterium]|jgi:sec-independent protein translocase protein TatB
MSLPDTIFIFALALVIFGPKKLPEIGRQLGKLVLEFRRASNEFKMQIEEELRTAEEQERQKQLAAQAAAASANAPAAATVTSAEASPEASAALTIRPPSTGTQVSAESPSQAYQGEEPATAHEALSPEQPSVTVANQEGLEEHTTNHHG